MCGIAGFIDYQGQLSELHLDHMGKAIARRGPDFQGTWYKAPVGLVHRRLSILDLSEAANQPMTSADGRYVMVYNGEVYNYKELAQELGLTDLKTTGDSEVILEAFCRLGPDFVLRLNGIFAIAIWDTSKNALHLFRDHIGVKPLYYLNTASLFGFGSELKALLAIPAIRQNNAIDPSAVNAFLHLTYIPGELSIYDGIKKLLPGHRAVYQNGELRIERYWNMEEGINNQKISNEAEAVTQLHSLLRSSVSSQMISDVPLGTFLSGGIDSSLVTALAAEFSPHQVRTFSIGFKESKFDESGYARQVANHLKTDHTEFILTQQEAQARFSDILDSYDEPFGDSSAIPTMLVSELARKQVTVILSGDGGDETHLGYGSYNWARRLDTASMRMFHKPLSALLSVLPDRYKRVGQLLNFAGQDHLPSHIFSQEQYAFSRSEIGKLVKTPYQAAFALPEFPDRKDLNLSPAEQQALFDLKSYLPDDLLVKVDRASMRYGLEVRVPLLDHRLVTFALNLPESMRADAGVTKRLLKQILYQYVPKEVFDRPKWGFGMPIGDWLISDWQWMIDRYLSRDYIYAAGLVEWKFVHQLVFNFTKGHRYLWLRIWLLILLHQWYENRFLSLSDAQFKVKAI
jgi:asparagine synthase (glutamine-hydrolysing)